MKVGNKVTAYKYNKNDELLRTDTLNTDTEEDSVVVYKYNKNGNQLATVNRYEIPSDRKDNTYVDIDVTLGDNRLNENVVNHYNALNQLTQTLTKNYKVSFTYDAEGLRTSKTVNGEKTVFVWDGNQLVMELSEGGKLQKRYIRGTDLVYADKGENTEKQYYVTDPHGNVVQLTDESGKVTKTYEYDSFGNEVKLDGKDDNPFRYCREYYDKEAEELYLRARYYQPAVGRFLTKDTYTGENDEPLSLHLYTYCGNDGVNSIDPSGHWGMLKIKNATTQKGKAPNVKYVFIHQNITMEAILLLNSKNNKSSTLTSSDLHSNIALSKKELNYILDGSILPDYLKQDQPYSGYKWKIKKKKKILGMNLAADADKFHGKNRYKLEKLKEDAIKKFKKSG
ncbi:MAG: RHS repeat-associated core domain-containing protein [Eubacterium sp.]|nr:RHS repeat-associated core domain-containing protein [Eubacterium sp.]